MLQIFCFFCFCFVVQVGEPFSAGVSSTACHTGCQCYRFLFCFVVPLRVWESHRGVGVNILFENGQYPHNSSYEAPCLP